MTMLDQIRQIFSPQKDITKQRRTSSNGSSEIKFGKLKIKGKKNDKKPIVEEKKPYLEPDACQHRAAGFDLFQLIRKPSNIDDKEWFATHTISLFHNINLLYGTISEFCTAESCPLMQGPCQTQYTWLEERGKKLKCTAPQYIDYVMTFCQKCVSNQELFPTMYAQDFSENFLNETKKMLRFLFNVLSHLYYAHFIRIRQLDLHVYLNIAFKHFTYFVREFNLLDRRDTASLDDLVDMMGLFSSDANTERLTTAQGDSARNSASPNVQNRSSVSIQQFRTQNSPVNLARGNGSTPVNIQHWPTST